MTCPTCKELKDKLAIAEEALAFFAARERIESELHRIKYIVMHGHTDVRAVARATLNAIRGTTEDELPDDVQAAIAEAQRKMGG